jgi:hypothetical protein
VIPGDANCAITNASIDNPIIDCADIPSSNINLTITDATGYESMCSFDINVTVEDTTLNDNSIAIDVSEYGGTVELSTSVDNDSVRLNFTGDLPTQGLQITPTGNICDCPPGYAVTGYRAGGGGILDYFDLICSKVNTDGSFGPETFITCGGFGDPDDFPLTVVNTSPNSYMVGFDIDDVIFDFCGPRTINGITGYSNDAIDILAIESNNSNTTNILSQIARSFGGGPNVTDQQTSQEMAPAGHVIVGMQVDTSSCYTNSVRFRHARLSDVITPTYLNVYNGCGITSAELNTTTYTCSDNGLITDSIIIEDGFGNLNTFSIDIVTDDEAPVPRDQRSDQRALTVGSSFSGAAVAMIFQPDINGELERLLIRAQGSVAGTWTAEIVLGSDPETGLVVASETFSVTTSSAAKDFLFSNPGIVNAGTFYNIRISGGPGQITLEGTNSNSYADGFVRTSVDGINYDLGSGGNDLYFNTFVTVLGECTEDIVVNVDPGLCVRDLTYATPIAMDNCDGQISVLLLSGLPNGSDFPIDTTEQVYQFTDAAGNSSTCSFNVIVNDNESPSIVPTRVLDQSQTSSTGGFGGVSGEIGLAMTFIPSTSGYLRELRFVQSTTNNFQLSIRDGSPTGSELASQSYNAQNGLTTVYLDSPVFLVSDSMYAFTIVGSLGSEPVLSGSTAGSYTGGNLWNSFDGTSWSALNTSWDLVFYTYMSEDPPLDVTLDFAGLASLNAIIDNNSVVITQTALPNDIVIDTILVNDNCSTINSAIISPSNFSCNDLGQSVVTVTAFDNFGNSDSYDVPLNILNGGGCFSLQENKYDTESRSTETDLNNIDASMEVYPNPSFDYFIIEIEGLKKTTELSVLDVSGRLIHDQIVSGGTREVRLDISDAKYPSGVVLIQMVIDDKLFFKRATILK